MYVSKFEKKVPTEEIGVVVAAARGLATRKEGLSAGTYAVGCAVEFLPDERLTPTPGPGPNPMVNAAAEMSDEDLATALEGHLPAMSAGPGDAVSGPLVWSLVIPILQMLLQRWLKPAGA